MIRLQIASPWHTRPANRRRWQSNYVDEANCITLEANNSHYMFDKQWKHRQRRKLRSRLGLNRCLSPSCCAEYTSRASTKDSTLKWKISNKEAMWLVKGLPCYTEVEDLLAVCLTCGSTVDGTPGTPGDSPLTVCSHSMALCKYCLCFFAGFHFIIVSIIRPTNVQLP